MKIIKLMPQGFCFGVAFAYHQTKKIIEQNPNKKIYMLGWLVHNQSIIDEFKSLGLIILDDKQKSRFELIKSLEKNTENDILLLSAHGTDQQTISLAKQKGFKIFDLTCKYVYKSHYVINEKMKDDYEIIFIGKKKHPETLAIKSLSPNIKIIESESDIENLSLKQYKKIFCTNQTTLGIYFLENLFKKINSKFPNVQFQNDICDATNQRQLAVINMDKDIDICIIIGDKRSSNCNELLKIASEKVDSYLVSKIEDINLSWFKNKNKCAITAGASTPSYLIDQIIDFLNEKL